MIRALLSLWVSVTRPLGWLVSRGLLAIVYFGVITPLGLAMRLAGRDTMRRRFDKTVGTYWQPHDPVTDPRRYYRQF